MAERLRARVRHDPVLLDLDGTVVDSAEAIFASVRAACAAVGVTVDERLDLSFCLGPPLNHSLERLTVTADRMADAIAVFEAFHWDEAVRLLRPMPGATEALDAFSARGVATAIVTLKPTEAAERVLDTLGLDHLVDVVIGRDDDFDLRTKTELLAEALSHPLLTGDRPVYVGDQPSDEAAARAHGVDYYGHPATGWHTIREIVLGR